MSLLIGLDKHFNQVKFVSSNYNFLLAFTLKQSFSVQMYSQACVFLLCINQNIFFNESVIFDPKYSHTHAMMLLHHVYTGHK